MPDINEKIIITAEGDGAKQAIDQLNKVADAGAKVVPQLNAVKDSAKQTSEKLTSMSDAAKSVWSSLALLGSGALAASILTTAKAAEAMAIGLKNVSGNETTANLEFLNAQVDKLGLNLESSTKAFVGLTAASRGTSLEGNKTRDIFKGVAEASTALHLSASSTEGALLAIQQMMSKGTVQAEELRGQLGERLPGAFNIAARSMNVTTAQLGKMLETGNVLAADFLPKFAAQLHAEFGKQAEESAHSLTAELNRLNTAWFSLKASIGQQASGVLKELAHDLVSVAEFARQNLDVITSLAETVATVALAYKGWQLVMAASAIAAEGFGAALTAAVTSPLVAIASLTLALKALYEMYKMLNAEADERKSASNLSQQVDAQRKSLEDELPALVKSGKISPEKAAAIKESLAFSFAPTTTTEAFGDGMVAQEVTRPASAEDRFDALKRARREVHPELVGSPAEPFKSADGGMSQEESDRLTKAYNELIKLRQQLTVETETGLQKDLASAERAYEAREKEISQASEQLNLGIDEIAQLNKMNEAVRATAITEANRRAAMKSQEHWHKIEAKEAQEASEAMRGFEEGLTQAALGSSETRTERVKREFDARIQLYTDLEAKGLITEIKMGELEQQARAKRAQSLASSAGDGRNDAQGLSASASGGSWAAQTVEINRQYKIRRDNLDAYYANELEKAQGNAQKIKEIEQDKTKVYKELVRQQTAATNELAIGLQNIGQQGARQFASGLGAAFISIVDGSKSAAQAFKDFAVEFLKQIAQMILQLLIFQAIKTALAGTGFGAALGFSGGGTATAAAKGGMFPTMAAAGMLMAAGGVDGVAATNGPTMFPKFNVLAGEAGREMLTVLAKPQSVNVDGVRAVIGNAGPNRLALMSADDLMALTRPNVPQAFAGGGVVGGSVSSAASSGPMRGGAVVEVRLSAGLEAQITQNAIQGATVKVTQDMTRDTDLRRATQRAVN